MSKRLRNILIGIGATVLSSCNYTPKHFIGNIVNMEHQPDSTWVTSDMSYDMIKTPGKLTRFSTEYNKRFDDEDFMIKVEGKRDGSDKIQTRTFYVDKIGYDTLSIGDEFDYDGYNAQISDYNKSEKITKKEYSDFKEALN